MGRAVSTAGARRGWERAVGAAAEAAEAEAPPAEEALPPPPPPIVQHETSWRLRRRLLIYLQVLESR